jgi:hypothetical protein
MSPTVKRRASGYYTRIARVKGVVAKFFPERASPKEARQLERLHAQYIDLLERAGITVAKTRLVTKPVGNQAKIRIVQEPFDAREIASSYLKRCDGEEAVNVARKIFEQTTKILAFNRSQSIPRYGLIVGADFKPDNIAIRNGEIIYIDTFSPHLRSAQHPEKVHPTFERYFRRQGRILNWLTKGYLTETVYDPRLRFITLLGRLCRIRPELRREFIRTAREVVTSSLPPKEAHQILIGLSTGRIVAQQVIGTGIHFLGKRKGKNIQV